MLGQIFTGFITAVRSRFFQYKGYVCFSQLTVIEELEGIVNSDLLRISVTELFGFLFL